ncbi:MAG: polysaccharide deacetylase family protein [Porphyromonadaceae bacterium CG2_30_38_12]|nr:MAG: polysaccharide deacetylase family protein [Porphyromonadaceae bacterium CG2_30_38_12]
MNLQFPRLLRPLLGGYLVWHKPTSSKVIYLTFDDGPVPEVTPTVLDILDQYGWKATFFCVGDNVAKYPALYAEILRRGHHTANHTYNHLKGFSTNTASYVANVNKAATLIQSNLFRPPHGQITFKQQQALKSTYRIIMWDVISYDFDKKQTPQHVFKTVAKRLRNGSIVVFHDSLKAQQNMLQALPQCLEFWISQGYRGKVL